MTISIILFAISKLTQPAIMEKKIVGTPDANYYNYPYAYH